MRLFLCILALAWVTGVRAEDRCFVCNKPAVGNLYLQEDQVTGKKEEIFENCAKRLKACSICGMPAYPDAPGFVRLVDGRVLCGRDAKTAVLEERDGFRIFHEVRDNLDRRFSRFTSFPNDNITLAMVDRVHLQELFVIAGNDYHCPNVLGYTQSEPDGKKYEHRISLMTGLPMGSLYAVCAHELTHAWVAENVSPNRRRGLARETEEGFCELMAYLSTVERDDEVEKKSILHNGYTRGQIDLFIAAESSYGLNDVLDWMRYGTDSKLSAAEPTRIHKVNAATKKAAPSFSTPVTYARVAPPPPPTTLQLKAVFWDPKRPLALINDHTFGLQEEGQARLGTSNVTVRCLAITPSSARIRVAGSADEIELKTR